MIKALWFIAKIIILTAAAVWVAEIPGTAHLSWQGYDVRMELGVLLACFLAVLVLALILYRMMLGVAAIPGRLKRHFEKQGRAKGLRALVLGLNALAVGDGRQAGHQAHRALRFLPENKDLPLLLKAQAERMQDKKEAAQKTFYQLLDNPDTAFWGVRGLMQGALEEGNDGRALQIGREALRLYPRQIWILYAVYRLEVRARDWEQAGRTLERLSGTDFMPAETAKKERIAIIAARTDEALKAGKNDEAVWRLKEASKIDPLFVPVVTRLARLYLDQGKRRQAAVLLEKTWKKNPHQDLVPLWLESLPKTRRKPPGAQIHWLQKLNRINPENTHAHMALARISMQAGLWGEARREMELCAANGQSAMLYALWADLEEKAGGAPEAVDTWKEKALSAPPSPAWVCKETGRIYEQWEPVAMPHEAFNSIVWGLPQSVMEHSLAAPSHDIFAAPPSLMKPAHALNF